VKTYTSGATGIGADPAALLHPSSLLFLLFDELFPAELHFLWIYINNEMKSINK
jgi:hypothetical protein